MYHSATMLGHCYLVSGEISYDGLGTHFRFSLLTQIVHSSSRPCLKCLSFPSQKQQYLRLCVLFIMATPAAPLTPAEEAYALAHTPGLAPPRPDIVPNFIDPYSRAYLIVTTTAVTLTVTTVLVLIRTYTKRFINKTGLGWDDCE